jgi:hypothetical protein
MKMSGFFVVSFSFSRNDATETTGCHIDIFHKYNEYEDMDRRFDFI